MRLDRIRRTFQHGLDARNQFTRTNRFGDVIVGPGPEGFHLAIGLRPGGEHDDRHVRHARIGLDMPADFIAVHLRHHDIQNDQVWQFLSQETERLRAAEGFDHFEFLSLECQPDQGQSVLIVVHYENTLTHRKSSRSAKVRSLLLNERRRSFSIFSPAQPCEGLYRIDLRKDA